MRYHKTISEILLSRESETEALVNRHSWIGTREKTIKEKTEEERERR